VQKFLAAEESKFPNVHVYWIIFL